MQWENPLQNKPKIFMRDSLFYDHKLQQKSDICCCNLCLNAARYDNLGFMPPEYFMDHRKIVYQNPVHNL